MIETRDTCQNLINNIIPVRWSSQAKRLLKAQVQRKKDKSFKKKKDKQRSQVTIKPTALNGCQHLSWCVQPLISTSSCCRRRRSPPPVSWHFLIFLATRVWRLRACVSRPSLQNPPNKQEISPRSPANTDPLLWLPLVSADDGPALGAGDVISNTPHALKLVTIHFNLLSFFFFVSVVSGSRLTHTSSAHFPAFLPPHVFLFVFSADILSSFPLSPRFARLPRLCLFPLPPPFFCSHRNSAV